jgi:hypothetical protein
MSNSILAELLSAHAFDGSPLHVDMPVFHVPFDDRFRRGTESGVVRAAQSTERLGVRGRSAPARQACRATRSMTRAE